MPMIQLWCHTIFSPLSVSVYFILFWSILIGIVPSQYTRWEYSEQSYTTRSLAFCKDRIWSQKEVFFLILTSCLCFSSWHSILGMWLKLYTFPPNRDNQSNMPNQDLHKIKAKSETYLNNSEFLTKKIKIFNLLHICCIKQECLSICSLLIYPILFAVLTR